MALRGSWDIFINDGTKYIILYFEKNNVGIEEAVCAKWLHNINVETVRAIAKKLNDIALRLPISEIENVIFNWL